MSEPAAQQDARMIAPLAHGDSCIEMQPRRCSGWPGGAGGLIGAGGPIGAGRLIGAGGPIGARRLIGADGPAPVTMRYP